MHTTTNETANIFATLKLSDESLGAFAQALDGYQREIEEQKTICSKHASTAAIHTKGKELQLYRLFHRDAAIAEHLRRVTETLPSWQKSLDWEREGKKWEKLERDIVGRMTKHKEILPLVTKGVEWEGRPVLIHAYKFEADPMMKVELVLPHLELETPVLPLRIITSALKCHEHLVPDVLGEARPPYERHEVDFLTIPEYLSQTMPPELYTTNQVL